MTVVVGYVPTQTGFFAVTEAVREAKARDLAIVLVNVVGPAGYRAPTAADERDLDAVTAYLKDEDARHSIRHIETDGTPADVILEVAHEVGAQLIVLGLHQRPWLARRVLGSTARSVVLAAPCPVLIVPDVDQPAREPLPAPFQEPPLPSMGQS